MGYLFIVSLSGSEKGLTSLIILALQSGVEVREPVTIKLLVKCDILKGYQT